MRNKHFKSDFGKKAYDEQKKRADYKNGLLKKVKHPRGRV